MNPLIPLHVLTGFGGTLLPIWIALELLKPFNEILMRPIKVASALSLALIIISWITGGLYYLEVYGPVVKPAIKTTQPWVHEIVMESKEHIFLFIPFLALMMNVLVWNLDRRTRRLLLFTIISIVVLGLIMTITGFMISGAREAAGVIV